MGTWYLNAVVKNVSTAPVTWTFPLTLNGTISDLVGAVDTMTGTTPTGTTYEFSGVSYDATLPPDGLATIFFELTGTQPPLPAPCEP
jgi:hypothetical protein